MKQIPIHFLSVNFYFLNNGKRYNRDFFSMNTIDNGLSFDGVRNILSLKISATHHTSCSHDMISVYGSIQGYFITSARWRKSRVVSYERAHRNA